MATKHNLVSNYVGLDELKSSMIQGVKETFLIYKPVRSNKWSFEAIGTVTFSKDDITLSEDQENYRVNAEVKLVDPPTENTPNLQLRFSNNPQWKNVYLVNTLDQKVVDYGGIHLRRSTMSLARNAAMSPFNGLRSMGRAITSHTGENTPVKVGGKTRVRKNKKTLKRKSFKKVKKSRRQK